MNTNTDPKTQENSPCSSDDENEDNDYKYVPKPVHDQIDSNEIIYHVDPEAVIKLNPELEGKVFQSFLFCTTCQQYKKMTQTNSYCIPLSERSFYKQYFIHPNAFCMEPDCIKKIYS